jgi:hypothetical protein
LAKSPTVQAKLDAGIPSRESGQVKTSKASKPKSKNLDPLHGSYSKCVDMAVQSGKLTVKAGQDILASEDINKAISEMVEGLSRKKREAAIDSVRVASAWEDITSHPDGLYAGLMAMLAKDPSGKAGFNNIDKLGQFYEGKYHAGFADALSRFRTRSLGWTQDEEALKDLVRGLFGKTDIESDIKGFKDDWLNIQEGMRKDFNAKGGSISKNESHVLPQNHDAQEMLKVGREGWIDTIRDLIDRDKMLNSVGNRMDDAEYERSLNFVFESATTGGLNKTADFTAKRVGTKLSRKGSAKRFLHFKDAESWLTYQDKFGRGNILATLSDHITNMANDIAVMERFGTNPRLNFDRLKTQVEKTKPMSGREKSFSEAVFKTASGSVDAGHFTTAADFMDTTTNVLVSSMLGKAFLSSLSDIPLSAITSNFNGMSAMKVWKRQASLMNPKNEADRVTAVKLGLIAENWTHMANGSNRFADVFGTGLSAKVSGTVMRGSVLATWTDSGRKAFGMEFSSLFANNFGKTFDELAPEMLKGFESYGIKADDWDLFRASETLDFKGSKFADLTKDSGTKFHQMIMSETDYAVPTPDARVKAITTGGLGRATASGMAWRTVMMFTSFPLTIMSTHFYRAANQATLGGKLAYSGAVLASTAAMGAVVLQSKDIAAGRTPRDMNNMQFLVDAMVQGGGAALVADTFLKDQNKFGGGIIKGRLGPKVGLLEDIGKLTAGNIQDALAGKDANVWGESVDFANRYTPDVWQTQLISNAIFDQIKIMGDPKAEKNFNRLRKKRKKEYGSDYWWRRGEALPESLND